MLMLWLKAFHIIAMVAWFSGIFYLPRLFVYHADLPQNDSLGDARFCTMERRLYWGIMTPSAFVTLFLGVGLMHAMKISFHALPVWLMIKLGLVLLVIFYHLFCGHLLKKFQQHCNSHSAKFYRCINEVPVLLLVAIVLLVVLKPY